MKDSQQRAYDAVAAPVAALHVDVIKYATVIQDAFNRDVGGIDTEYRLSDAAIARMAIDCVALHGAVRDACACGWAVAAPMLLRSQLELLLGCMAIYFAGDRSDLLAYKYHFMSTKALIRQPGLPRDRRERFKSEARRFLEFLPPGQREEVSAYLWKGKVERYWYCPDYSGPREVLTRAARPDLHELYASLSGGVHGGTLGVRMWRDIPDQEHPGPRRDPSAQSFAVSGSNAVTMQAVHMRLVNQGVVGDQVFEELWAQHLRNRELVQELFSDAMTGAKRFVDEHLSPSGEESGPSTEL